MPEGGEGLDKIHDLASKLRKTDLYKKSAEFGRRLDGDYVKAKDTLEELAPALNFLVKPTTLPGILEFSTEDKEYVSVRRIDGSVLERGYTKEVKRSDEPLDVEVVASIPTNLVKDDQILIFISPSLEHWECRNPQKEEKIIDKIDDELARIYGFTYLWLMTGNQELFDIADWQPALMEIMLVVNKGGKFYKANLYSATDRDGNIETSASEVRRIYSNEESGLEFPYMVYFLSQLHMDTSIESFKKYGRIYILNEGSSEKERHGKSVPRPLMEKVVATTS